MPACHAGYLCDTTHQSHTFGGDDCARHTVCRLRHGWLCRLQRPEHGTCPCTSQCGVHDIACVMHGICKSCQAYGAAGSDGKNSKGKTRPLGQKPKQGQQERSGTGCQFYNFSHRAVCLSCKTPKDVGSAPSGCKGNNSTNKQSPSGTVLPNW
eukprot:5852628-Amphidinium_carterae.1